MDPLTIVFALVAVLVIWKLNSVLGRNTGFQGPRAKPREPVAGRSEPPQRDNVVRLPGAAPAPPVAPDPQRWQAFVETGSTAPAGLDAIAARDPGFSAAPFLDGARTAYEAIVTAFASGERRTLQALLARDVYQRFEAAIVERDARKETLSTTLVSIDETKVTSASLEGRTAQVGVRFLTKQISATRNADGSLAGGSPDRIVDMDDLWTFARDTGSRDPNWKLVATDSGR